MRITVVGLGNLGGPLADLLTKAGHKVQGCDRKVMEWALHPAFHPGYDVSESVPVSTDGAGMVFIVVPTPSLPDGTYDTAMVLSVLEEIEPGPIIVVVSTVLPGDCDAMSLVTGHRIVYSPEFVRLGHVKIDMMDPDFILIGEPDQEAGDAVTEIMRSVAEGNPPIARLTVVEAELAKLAVNTFVTTKISYANMVGEIAEQLGCSAASVCHAVGLDHRIGNAYLRPGGAYRGPCFPRDNRALAALAHRLGTTADLAEATDRINRRQTKFFPEEGGRGY